MHSVIFLSNCYGEDRSAAIIAKELKKINPEIEVQGAPLISKGEEYEKRNIPLLIQGKVPPSGGFPTRSIKGFIADAVTSSYIPLRYLHTLRRYTLQKKGGQGEKTDCVVAVGDISLLLLGYLGIRKKIIFLAPAKSDYQNPHYRVERWLLRKLCIKVFTHDEYTAQNLRKERINAEFVGNPMVDELNDNAQCSILNSKLSISILPGSREEGYRNFLKILTVVEQVAKKYNNVSFAAALPSTINLDKLAALCGKDGWTKDNFSITKGDIKIFIYYNNFVDVVKTSDIIIGLAGTANEQAAALGKPIVAFKGTGPQTTDVRMRNQENLLGGCLRYIRDFPNGVVNEVISLLGSKELREARGELGKKRMGPAGGARKIAEFVIRYTVTTTTNKQTNLLP